MDKINLLSDDLLLRILSLVPIKDVIMAASCVSKRWRSLRSLVSRIELDDLNYHNDDADYKSFTQFVYRALMSNKAPVIERLHLKLGPKCRALDVGIWIDIAVSRRVSWLVVEIRSGSSISLPSSLFTCETLENLTLVHCLVLDEPCCRLPFLKSLCLKHISYACLPKLLSGCPNLQVLQILVEEEEHGGEDITIALPCLRHLSLWDSRSKSKGGGVYVIKAPHLEYLKIVDDAVYDSGIIENMPNLNEAHVDITHSLLTHMFLSALASTRRLYLCVSLLSEVSSMGINFHRLVHLELNTCAQGWWELLTQMLQNSPKLASLQLTDEHEILFPSKQTPECWKQPSSIPESLEKFVWKGYKGRRGDLEMATYIIKNATSLKTAHFSPQGKDFEAKYMILKDLVSVLTPSLSCKLLFY